MDIVELDESLLEELTVTGVSYQDGILRVQQSRGNFSDADRHIRLFLRDEEGNERTSDYSVMWQEEISGERVQRKSLKSMNCVGSFGLRF